MVNAPDNSYEIISNKHDGFYRKVVLKDGLVVGMVFVSRIDKSGIVLSLMKDRINVNGFKQALIAEDFGLASLPEEIWRSRLGVQSAGLVSTETPLKQAEEITLAD